MSRAPTRVLSALSDEKCAENLFNITKKEPIPMLYALKDTKQ